ncbi:hypothetical protein EZV62_006070 [Acer yangbiense]|uniref:Kazal-like domain-containing protein n=1 Tax=Acer yangbiense TaxID=1000413 RepID=A0A5C7IPI2_9ROSI|nr:hypothetical protein EZV62_006070 [Acer yangbiense]
MFLAFSNFASFSIFIAIFSLTLFSHLTVRSDATTDICPAASDRPTYCPVRCFTTNPVCGDNGVTYWCGCTEALCAGAKVAKTGFCEVGNNGGTASTLAQALLLLHIVWLIITAFSVFGSGVMSNTNGKKPEELMKRICYVIFRRILKGDIKRHLCLALLMSVSSHILFNSSFT